MKCEKCSGTGFRYETPYGRELIPPEMCMTCRGTGVLDNPCTVCKGNQWVGSGMNSTLCEHCKGEGHEPEINGANCANCNPAPGNMAVCSRCNGMGMIASGDVGGICPDCGGSGHEPAVDAVVLPPPMSSGDQCKAFLKDLNALVDRYRKEFDLTYPQAVGALHIVAADLCADANRRNPPEE